MWLFAIIWVLSGVGMWAVIIYCDWNNGGDISAKDLAFFLLFGVGGFIAVIVSICALLSEDGIGDYTVIRGRRKK